MCIASYFAIGARSIGIYNEVFLKTLWGYFSAAIPKKEPQAAGGNQAGSGATASKDAGKEGKEAGAGAGASAADAPKKDKETGDKKDKKKKKKRKAEAMEDGDSKGKGACSGRLISTICTPSPSVHCVQQHVPFLSRTISCTIRSLSVQTVCS